MPGSSGIGDILDSGMRRNDEVDVFGSNFLFKSILGMFQLIGALPQELILKIVR